MRCKYRKLLFNLFVKRGAHLVKVFSAKRKCKYFTTLFEGFQTNIDYNSMYLKIANSHVIFLTLGRNRVVLHIFLRRDLQSRKIYVEENGVIQLNWTGKVKFVICFCVFFN